MKRLCGSAERRARTGDAECRDTQLLRQVQLHDQVVFREVVEQLKTKVFAVSYALLGNASEADVAAQEVFVRLYRKAERAGRQHSLTKCAYRFTVDRCIVELKLRRLRRLFGWLTRSTSIPHPNELPAADENRIVALRALSLLPDRERALLVLREVADQTVEEIAEIMRLHPAVVRQRLFAARQRLRVRVQPL